MISDWLSFIENIPANCKLQVRISDNVLDEEDWPVDTLTINDGVVLHQVCTRKGCYTIDNMVGWTIDQLKEWSSYDTTGSHPEMYYEVRSTS